MCIRDRLSAQEPEDGEKTADPADSTLALEHVTFGYEKERTILHDEMCIRDSGGRSGSLFSFPPGCG